jgi:transposase-like protein
LLLCRCGKGKSSVRLFKIKHQGQLPETITLDGYVASHRAVREMSADGLLPEDANVRTSKYLNNLIEQDHRNVKSRTNVML